MERQMCIRDSLRTVETGSITQAANELGYTQSAVSKMISDLEQDWQVKLWECRNCGHIVVGTKAPDVCPTCNHPQSYFEVHAENY